MDQRRRYKLYGANGSPYSCKIRSYLRFKRIPFDWVPPSFAMGVWPKKFSHIKPKVIPVLEFPDEFSMNESTAIIKKIEESTPNRSVFIQNNCYLQFISNIIEDFADEWVTKLMFGVRWNREIDQNFSSTFITYNIPYSKNLSQSRKFFCQNAVKRQVDRRGLVGCSDDDMIHSSLNEICSIMEKHLTNNYFLFGNRPTNGDFALYGQLGQFRVDCTSDSILREKYPLLFCWLYKMDDLSGIDIGNDDAMSFKFELCDAVLELLKICGNVYLPFLQANSNAIMNNKKEFNVNVKINEKEWIHKQNTFKWQARCLKALKKEFETIMSKNESSNENQGNGKVFGKDDLVKVLKNTNCWYYLNENVKSKL